MKLNSDILALLDGPVAISVATCDADHWPSLAHGYGCRWDPVSNRLRVFVLEDEAQAILANIVVSGAVAAVFSDVRSFRSLQIKAGDATLRSFDAEDAACQRQHHRKTSDELIELGYAPGPARGYFDVPQGARFVTLAFTPRDLFQQSPGPEAGMRLPEADWAETETNVVPLAAKARRSSAARVTAREDLMAVTQL